MNVNEIHKARRMLKAIYRLADQPDETTLSDIRYFARAGVLQLNRMLDQASQRDHRTTPSAAGMPIHEERQRIGA